MALPNSLPEPAEQGHGPRVSIAGGGHDRFGAIADLAVFRETARALASGYAKALGITEEDLVSDPDVTVLCIGMALARQEEMSLQQQIQRDLAERAALLGDDHGKALFTAVKNEIYTRHQKAIDRIHLRATRYREELESLIQRRRRKQGE